MSRKKLSYVFEELEKRQGWNNDILLDLLVEWVEYHSNEESDCIEFLEQKAREENDDEG